jgi:hypothetical protein
LGVEIYFYLCSSSLTSLRKRPSFSALAGGRYFLTHSPHPLRHFLLKEEFDGTKAAFGHLDRRSLLDLHNCSFTRIFFYVIFGPLQQPRNQAGLSRRHPLAPLYHFATESLRGLGRTRLHVLLAATACNIKRMVKLLCGKPADYYLKDPVAS